MAARQEHAHCMCLICGDKLGVYDAREGKKQTDYAKATLACSHSDDSDRPCKFRVHIECWKVHCDMNEEDGSGFECKRVMHQIRKETVVQLKSETDLQSREQLIGNLNKLNRVKVSKCKRKRRYQNSNDICKICGEEVPFHQKSHLLQHCMGVGATPVVVEDITDYAALGNSCFEIRKRRLEKDRLTLSNPGTPQRSRAVGWG